MQDDSSSSGSESDVIGPPVPKADGDKREETDMIGPPIPGALGSHVDDEEEDADEEDDVVCILFHP